MGNDKEYASTFDCFKKILKTHGFRGLFKGGVATMWREFPPGGFILKKLIKTLTFILKDNDININLTNFVWIRM